MFLGYKYTPKIIERENEMKIKIYENVSFREMENIVENFEKDNFKIIDVDVIDIIVKEEYGKSEYKRLIIKYEYQKEYLERLKTAKREEDFLFDNLIKFDKERKLSRFINYYRVLKWYDNPEKKDISDYLSIKYLKSIPQKKLVHFGGIGKKTVQTLLEFLKQY